MNGLELSKLYYQQIGRPMLEEKFAEYLPRLAAGLVGEGSECFGFDDEISRDHDFGPGFCIWLCKEDFDEIGAEMQKAYDSLPKEFMGYSARNTSPRGGGRVGVFEISSFSILITLPIYKFSFIVPYPLVYTLSFTYTLS